MWEHLYESVLRPVLEPVYRWLYGPWLAAAAWLLGVFFLAAWWRGDKVPGASTVTQPGIVAVALGGAVVVALLLLWRGSRVSPLILVADFAAYGQDAASEAEAFRDRLVDAIRGTAGGDSVGGLSVRRLGITADPDESAPVRRRARASRAAALVTGKVRVDTGQWHWDVRVVTTDQRVVWAPVHGSDGIRSTIPAQEITIHETERTRMAQQVVAAAKAAVGFALYSRGRNRQAYTVLSAEGPTTALCLFYAAAAAMALGEWPDAHDRAAESFRVTDSGFGPAAAIAAVAAFTMDRPDLGRQWLKELSEAPSPGPDWGRLFTDVTYLARLHGLVDTFDDLSTQFDTAVSRTNARVTALEAFYESDHERVVAAYAGLDADLTASEEARRALSTAHVDPQRAGPLTARAEEAVVREIEEADGDRGGDGGDGLSDLIHRSGNLMTVARSYALLRDPDGFARAWASALRLYRTRGATMVEWELETVLDPERRPAEITDDVLTSPAVLAVVESTRAWIAESDASRDV